jgi:hypothetical protein
MPGHRDVRHTGKQRGAASLEFWVVCLALLPLILGSFQGVLLYNAKSVLNQATFEAARIGAVQHAQVAPMQAELARRLAGFYGPTGNALSYPQAYAKALTDITTPVTPDQRVGSGTTLRILNPTREAFNDFGEDLDGRRQIPNHHLKRRDTAVGPTSSVNIQDANLLKLEVTYGYRMTVPIAAPLIAAVMQIADPAHAAYYQASPPRLPLKASALVRMHSPAWLSAANVSVSAALNPGDAGGIGDGQGYQPLPGIGSGALDGAPDDTDPNAGYQPGDHAPIDTSPSDEGEEDGDDEGEEPGDGEGTAGEPYQCQGPDWTESWRIIKEGSAMERAVLARDILIAAVAGFGDQLYDLGVLIKDMGEAAWDIGNDIAEVGLGDWLRSKLQDAANAAGKAIDFMKDIDRVIASIEKLWNEREAIIEELKNGIGQDLYNLYIAPIECGPVDTMRLITQNFTPRVPLKVITAFNKLRKAMNLPEFPTNTPGDDKPDGDGGKPDDPDGDGNNPNAPNGLVKGKDRDGDGRDDETKIPCRSKSSFLAGTPVLTPEGLKPIESLQVGDLVWSRSDLDFNDKPQRILKTFRRTAPGYLRLTLENHSVIEVTGEHLLWQQGVGWREANAFTLFEPIAAYKDDLLVITRDVINKPVQVFNVSVENTPSYFTGEDSIWVHNEGDGSANDNCDLQNNDEIDQNDPSIPGSRAHKDERWQEYQSREGTAGWSYERWSNVYEENMTRARRGNAIADDYHSNLGWGEREQTVTIQTPNGPVSRRLDIADKKGKRAVEVKSGYTSRTAEIRDELKRDAELVKKNWDIEWHFDGTVSKPLIADLRAAGIRVTFGNESIAL